MDKIIHPTKQRYCNSRVQEIRPEEELIIYMTQNFMRVRLLEGEAECFGRELPLMETVFFFKGQNVAIFTWRGAKIELEIENEREIYTESKNPMRELVNLNHILQQMRLDCLHKKKAGPCVFVTGGSDTGKTSVCKILVNYCLKQGWTPILTDIDPMQNLISAPGCLSAALIENVIDGCTDNLTAKSINYFHGACQPGNFIITPDFFDT